MLQQVTEFLDYLRCEKRAGYNTRDAYGRDIFSLARFLKKTKWEDVNKDDLNEFLAHLHGKLSCSSINRRIFALKTFFKFLKREGYIKTNLKKYLDAKSKWKKSLKF